MRDRAAERVEHIGQVRASGRPCRGLMGGSAGRVGHLPRLLRCCRYLRRSPLPTRVPSACIVPLLVKEWVGTAGSIGVSHDLASIVDPIRRAGESPARFPGCGKRPRCRGTPVPSRTIRPCRRSGRVVDPDTHEGVGIWRGSDGQLGAVWIVYEGVVCRPLPAIVRGVLPLSQHGERALPRSIDELIHRRVKRDRSLDGSKQPHSRRRIRTQPRKGVNAAADHQAGCIDGGGLEVREGVKVYPHSDRTCR